MSLKGQLKDFITFFRKLWNKKEQNKDQQQGIFFNSISVLIASIKGFVDDRCFEKAATLTFYSLLSIVPLIAIGFGIAQSLGFAEAFAEQVKSQFHQQPQVAEKIIEFSNSTLKTTKGSIIAAFGLAVLLWTAFKMIGYIAFFFDEIWKVKSERTFWQQVKSYVPMILLFPIFLVFSSSTIIYMSTKAILAIQSINILQVFGPLIRILFQVIPYLISWGLLSFFYIFLPNTKVSWKAGLIAGVAIGLIYVSWQWVYVTFQLHASSYGAIYGSFAAVPLFLIWLNYSWLILLFGTEFSYHLQKKILPLHEKLD